MQQNFDYDIQFNKRNPLVKKLKVTRSFDHLNRNIVAFDIPAGGDWQDPAWPYMANLQDDGWGDIGVGVIRRYRVDIKPIEGDQTVERLEIGTIEFDQPILVEEVYSFNISGGSLILTTDGKILLDGTITGLPAAYMSFNITLESLANEVKSYNVPEEFIPVCFAENVWDFPNAHVLHFAGDFDLKNFAIPAGIYEPSFFNDLAGSGGFETLVYIATE